MKKELLFIVALVCSVKSFAGEPNLTEKMLDLDTKLFNSFNNCEDEKELSKHENFYDPNVEFYHDNAGVTWDRETMLENIKNNVCGNFTRELVAETFAAYPINNFGAITQGVHIFCESDTKKCEGKADFVMVWQNSNEKWKVTRVLSYGHRAND